MLIFGASERGYVTAEASLEAVPSAQNKQGCRQPQEFASRKLSYDQGSRVRGVGIWRALVRQRSGAEFVCSGDSGNPILARA
jgi:hypothetical protein